MQYIPIFGRKGMVDHAVVDDEDFEYLKNLRWNLDQGYARATIYVNGIQFRVNMHCLVMNGREIDHANRDKLDNQKSNLRFATRSQNCQNQIARNKKYAGRFKGVHYRGWTASIHVNGRRKHLGRFATEIAAAKAYNKAAKEVFGEFACLNEV